MRNNHVHRQAKIISASLRAYEQKAGSLITLRNQTCYFYHPLKMAETRYKDRLPLSLPHLFFLFSCHLYFNQRCIFPSPLYQHISGISDSLLLTKPVPCIPHLNRQLVPSIHSLTHSFKYWVSMRSQTLWKRLRGYRRK